MFRRVALSLLIVSSFAFAKPTTRPASTDPATQPSANSPATRPVNSLKFPTPAELVEKLKASQAAENAKVKVAYISLDEPLAEKPVGFSLFNNDAETLRELLQRLSKARDDKDVRGVLVTISPDFDINFAQAQEVRELLTQLRRAGKRVFVYADSYDTIAYLVAIGATDICLMDGGELFIPGVAIETMFYRGAIDKLGIEPDFVQVGEFKGAEEPYMRTGPSDELRGELNKIVDALYGQIVESIASHRNLPGDVVRRMVDDAMISASQAKQRGFVDHLVDKESLRELLRSELGEEVSLQHDYGKDDSPSLDFTNPLLLLSQIMKKPPPSTQPAVALVYAEGVISDGSAQESLFGDGGVGSEDIRKAMRLVARDEKIKAVVIRIDSPGGSALASEAMWQAVRRVARDKPVIVSIGGMAASGGYYLASAGDYVFADPAAIVGSIGVVGGKFVLKGLMDWAGLTTESFNRGRNADLFSTMKPWDERQRRMIRTWMRNTYDQFTQRVMATRKGKIADIDAVARGRIFLARDAKALGMVDELGGLDAAIREAARRGKLDEGSYEVRVVPPPTTLADLISGQSGFNVRSPVVQVRLAPDSVLRLLPAGVRGQLAQQLRLGILLQDRPVVLMSPYTITTR